MKKRKLVIITGKSGSGKDWVLQSANEPMLISYTTRDIRPKEDEEGYKFIKFDKELNRLVSDSFQMFVDTSTKNLYFTTHEDLEQLFSASNIVTLVATPDSIMFIAKQLQATNTDVIHIYIDQDETERRHNMWKRGNSEEYIEDRINGMDMRIGTMLDNFEADRGAGLHPINLFYRKVLNSNEALKLIQEI